MNSPTRESLKDCGEGVFDFICTDFESLASLGTGRTKTNCKENWFWFS